MRKSETYRNEIKSYIVRTGMTMTEVVDYLSDEYGWSRSVPNLSGKRHSLLNSALFHADNRTEQKTISPFSLASIFTFDFAALSERRSCPEDRSRRFVLLGALDAALRQRTYPVRTVMQFSRFRCDCKTILAKNIALSRISKRSENAPKSADFHAYGQDRKGQKFEGRTPLCSQNSPFRNDSKTCAWSAV